MKLRRFIFGMISLVFAFALLAAPAEAKDKHHMKLVECEEKAALTKKQQKHFERLFDELFDKKKEIFETAEAYGILSKEQKEKHIEMMKKHAKHMKKNMTKRCKDKNE